MIKTVEWTSEGVRTLDQRLLPTEEKYLMLRSYEEVAEAIKKSYDEYIIDPQVSVSLDKASSYRYSVIGDVAQPGIRLMSHRLTVTEALGEAVDTEERHSHRARRWSLP